MKRRIDPSFLLRGVDVAEVIEKFNNGEYDSIEQPCGDKLKSVSSLVFTKEYGQYPQDKNYKIRTGGQHQYFVTVGNVEDSGNKNKVSGNKNKATGNKNEASSSNTNETYTCDWCRKDFSHDPIGIPLTLKIDKKSGNIRCNVIGENCRFECAYADLLKTVGSTMITSRPYYDNSESNLLTLYKIKYPTGPKLYPAKDWKLYNSGKGPLSADEYYDKNHIYMPTNNIVLAPVREEYLKINV